MNTSPSSSGFLNRLKRDLITRFSLRTDQAAGEDIDQAIRSGIELKGTYLWTLMAAILIASIGLNINSSSVLIGAMLISPLMGPVIGTGYGIAIYDFALVRRSLKNLAIAAGISFITSSVYFLLTPLTAAKSELLTNASPTIWDLLVALFGGMAGIIGISRKERTNVIPGVAIATALMPPLCTSAYSFVNGNLRFFLGAIYLFFLNGIYIAVASIIMTWFIHPIAKRAVPDAVKTKMRVFLIAIITVSFIPSIFIAVNFVRNQIFEHAVARYISKELVFSKTVSVSHKASRKTGSLEVVLVGTKLDDETVKRLEEALPQYGLQDVKLTLKHIGTLQEEDVSAIKNVLEKEIAANEQKDAEMKEQILQVMEEDAKTAQQLAEEEKQNTYRQIAEEVRIQNPDISEVTFSEESTVVAVGKDSGKMPVVVVTSKKALKKDARTRLQKWLKVRMKAASIKVLFVTG